jgi:parallel beta-helix repeat protein
MQPIPRTRPIARFRSPPGAPPSRESTSSDTRKPGRSALSLAGLIALTAALQACGGGGDAGPAPGAASGSAQTSTATPAPAPANAPPTGAAADSAASSGSQSLLTQAGGDTEPAEAEEALRADSGASRGTEPAPTADDPPVPDSGLRRILAAGASMDVGGVTETPAPALSAIGGALRSFHVDSRLGDDRHDGRQATPDGTSRGPWRTLGRAMRAGLTAGDEVVLACGSRWREALDIPSSGTATQPLTVRSAPGCSPGQQPVIDGSVTLEPAEWQPQAGALWQARVLQPVLALHTAQGALVPAHHPNRGRDPALPASPYALLAADSPVVTVNSRSASQELRLGDDLQLPPGTRLQDGAQVRLRTNSWWMDESHISVHTGSTVRLTEATRYPAQAGWGYLLLGQAWMVDSPGEWHHDRGTGRLLAWMPDSAAPTVPLHATVLPTGVVLTGRRHVVIDGLVIRRVGTAVQADQSTGVTLRNLRIEDTAGVGVEASASDSLTLDGSALLRTGRDAVQGQTHLRAAATGLTVRNSLVRDSAVQMDGETVTSLPVTSLAALGAGDRARITGNVIVNSGYIGVRVGSDSEVSGNFVYGSCTHHDDCAGIYTWASRNTVIRDNVVVRSRGTTAGKPANERASAAQGIYLDESARGALVERNTVIDADHGIQLHVAQDSTLRANRLYGNRVSQIWLQETRNRDRPGGDLFGIVVEDNELAPVLPGSFGLLLQTRYQSTAGFGRFERNHYFDRVAPVVAAVDAGGRRQLFTAAQWRGSSGAGSVLPVDTAGRAASLSPFASLVPGGANVVPNADLQLGLAGWTHWNEAQPRGQLLLQTCEQGPCVRYVPGGSTGLVSSPNFSVIGGQWYRVTVDVAAEQDQQPVQLVLRRGGGGSNGYEPLTTQSLHFTAQRAMRRYAFLVQATQTVNARDPLTGDHGARLDIQGLVAGASVTLANPEVVPVQRVAQALVSAALVNAAGRATAAACPAPLQQAGLCGEAVLLGSQQPVQWPVSLPAHSAALLFVQPRILVDSDGDGVADTHDVCPGTPPGQAVDARGCALGQR